MSTTRFDFTRRNALAGYVSTLVTVVLGFIARTIFIQQLGSSYVGVHALFTSVLGVLSFVELGIGAAMSYSLYRPVAKGETEKVRAFARFYRTVYRVIALLVTLIGLAILPFIPMLAEGSEGLGDLRLYYVLFLASNVLSYFAVYKTTIAQADQRMYLVTNIRTVASVVVQGGQIAFLLMGGDYLIFLLVMLVGRAAEQLFLNIYLSYRYADLLKAPTTKLADDDLDPVKKNIRALIWHKVGEIGVHQSDAIIIAAFINVTTLGLISNYNLVINSITMFLTVTLTAAVGSFGNAIATTSPQDVYRNFKIYRLAVFCIYGVATIGMYILLTPFVVLWIGEDMVIKDAVILVILINFYLSGHRAAIVSVKSAAGVWAQDKYLPLIQTVVNLVISIVLVQYIGLIGVFIGTIVQGIIANIVRPIIVYPLVFEAQPREYFIDGFRYAVALLVAGAGPAALVYSGTLPIETWWSFVLVGIALVVWVSVVFAAFFAWRPEGEALRTRFKVFPPRHRA